MADSAGVDANGPAEYEDYVEECVYLGTEFIEVKIYLIGVFAVVLALLSLVFNSFFALVFIASRSLRHSPLFYFGALAILDTILAINFLALVVIPVYMDEFRQLWLYHLFLTYFRPLLTLTNIVTFGSVLLILMATMERFLATFFESRRREWVKRFMETNRPLICLSAIFAAFVYKVCTYFEIEYIEHENCTDWSKYEIRATPFVQTSPNYTFWWMFILRNLIDRIIPFFALLLMNILILHTIKKENRKLTLLEQKAMSMNEKATKRVVRDATRALIAVVSMYICSQCLQVIITFWEAIHRQSLEEAHQFYSYVNDAMCIMTLLCSTVRYPVYCSCNRPIYAASVDTLARLGRLFGGRAKALKPVRTVTIQNRRFLHAELLPAADHADPSASAGDKADKNNNNNNAYVVSMCTDDTDEQWMV